MLRHGGRSDPKADMMHPGLFGAGYFGAGHSGAGYFGAGHFRAGYSPKTACQPPLLSAFQTSNVSFAQNIALKSDKAASLTSNTPRQSKARSPQKH